MATVMMRSVNNPILCRRSLN